MKRLLDRVKEECAKRPVSPRYAWRDGKANRKLRKHVLTFDSVVFARLQKGAVLVIDEAVIFDLTFRSLSIYTKDWQKKRFPDHFGPCLAGESFGDISYILRCCDSFVAKWNAECKIKRAAISAFKIARAEKWNSKQHRKRLFPSFYGEPMIRPAIYDKFVDRPFWSLVNYVDGPVGFCDEDDPYGDGYDCDDDGEDDDDFFGDE